MTHKRALVSPSSWPLSKSRRALERTGESANESSNDPWSSLGNPGGWINRHHLGHRRQCRSEGEADTLSAYIAS
jgi:hypothetical protein